MYGEKRMLALIEEHTDRGGDLLDRILDSVTEFAGNRPQTDDITLLSVAR